MLRILARVRCMVMFRRNLWLGLELSLGFRVMIPCE